MTPKKLIAAIAISGAVISTSPLLAQDYRPEQFLSLDLWKAALSPQRLGPPAQFEAIRVEARATSSDGATQDAKPIETTTIDETAVEPARHVQASKNSSGPVDRRIGRLAGARTRLKTAFVPAHRGIVRRQIARRHGNPLDAQASDTRIQVWPCRAGGICNWHTAR